MTRPVGSQEELEARRRYAVALLQLGHGAYDVAEAVGAAPGSVYRWKEMFETDGHDGLAATPHSGGPSTKLPREQFPALAALLEEGPQAHGFETDRWTLARIAVIIRREFEVSVSQTTVWRYLTELGWSCQKPQRRARERDAEEVS